MVLTLVLAAGVSAKDCKVGLNYCGQTLLGIGTSCDLAFTDVNLTSISQEDTTLRLIKHWQTQALGTSTVGGTTCFIVRAKTMVSSDGPDTVTTGARTITATTMTTASGPLMDCTRQI